MSEWLKEVRTKRDYIIGSQERTVALYELMLDEVNAEIVKELVKTGEAYWARWRTEEFDGQCKVVIERKAFETYHEAQQYLLDEIDWDLREGVKGPPVNFETGLAEETSG